MEILERQKNVGIVVVGDFDPTRLTPKWLYDLNIITAEEWNGQERNLLVSKPITKFKFGAIEFLSQPNRIQLVSNDISKSNHLVNMTINILNNYPETTFKAVGLNAGLIFTFKDSNDSLRFGQFLGHLDAMKLFFGDPRLKSVVFEDNQIPNAETPKTSIQIQSEDIAEERPNQDNKEKDNTSKELVPVCSMQINNHYVVTSKEEVLKVVARAEVLHADFGEKYSSFFKGI